MHQALGILISTVFQLLFYLAASETIFTDHIRSMREDQYQQSTMPWEPMERREGCMTSGLVVVICCVCLALVGLPLLVAGIVIVVTHDKRDEAKTHKLGITILCIANLLLFASLVLSIIICCLVARGKLKIPSTTRGQRNNSTTTIDTQVGSVFITPTVQQPGVTMVASSGPPLRDIHGTFDPQAPPTYGAVVSGASMSYPTPQSQQDNQGAYPTFYGSGLHAEYNPRGQSDQSTEYYMVSQTQDGNQANCPGPSYRTQNQSSDPGNPVPGDVRNTTSQNSCNDVRNSATQPVELNSGDVQCEIVNARY